MNTINANVIKIQNVDNINIVSFAASSYVMKMLALELKEDLCVDSKVIIGVKATNVSITKQKIEMISVSNQLEVTIENIIMGKLLCSVFFKVGGNTWQSIITCECALNMQLKEGDSIVALIKSSELSIVGVLS